MTIIPLRRHAKRRTISPTARTAAQVNAVPGEGDAHATLVELYRDRCNSTKLRIEAARAALPYEKPRLAAAHIGADESESAADAARRLELLEKLRGHLEKAGLLEPATPKDV